MQWKYIVMCAAVATLVFAGCRSAEPEAITNEEDNTVELIFGEQEVSFTADHYAIMTEDALDLYEEVTPVFIEEEEQLRRWFIRYYIQKHEYNESWSDEELFLLAEERSNFESAWRNYAEVRYGITPSEDAMEEQASYNIELYEASTPASVQGMADGLDLTIEEFFREFDRDHVARTVIWEELFPILQEEYATEDEGETVSVAHQYSEEVVYSLYGDGPDFPSIPFNE